MSQPQFCKIFTFETVAKNIMQEKTIPYTVGMDKYLLNEYIHFFLVLYPCVKASSNIICGSFCCVSNFIYKFIIRGKKPVWLDSPWITARRSSCCVSATMFSLRLCDLKWQQEKHQNRRGRRLFLASRPQMGFSSPFEHLSKSQPQRRERTNPTAPRRKAAGPPHLPCPPREPGEART